jgi:threonine-phosphate decarboxylase
MHKDFLPTHGGQLRELSAEFGVPEASLVDFSASIHPQPPSDLVIETLCSALRGRKILTEYPDMHYSALKEAIASYTGVKRSSITVGSGVMPLLSAAVCALRPQKCLVPVPAFGEYSKVLNTCGVDCCRLELTPDNDFSLDCARVLAALKSSGAQALLLANPQSPSGGLSEAKQLFELYESAHTAGATVIVDEAFIDYTPKETLSPWAAKLPGLVVLRSLTKFFAMPGLRVAYSIACSDMTDAMESCMPAWPAGSIAAEAARMVLQNQASITATRETNAIERSWLESQLQLLGLRVFPSAANYLLVKIDQGRSCLEFWRRLIVEHGVVVRSCANFEGLDEHYFRIGVRTRSQNQVLVRAFEEVLQFSLQI